MDLFSLLTFSSRTNATCALLSELLDQQLTISDEAFLNDCIQKLQLCILTVQTSASLRISKPSNAEMMFCKAAELRMIYNRNSNIKQDGYFPVVSKQITLPFTSAALDV